MRPPVPFGLLINRASPSCASSARTPVRPLSPTRTSPRRGPAESHTAIVGKRQTKKGSDQGSMNTGLRVGPGSGLRRRSGHGSRAKRGRATPRRQVRSLLGDSGAKRSTRGVKPLWDVWPGQGQLKWRIRHRRYPGPPGPVHDIGIGSLFRFSRRSRRPGKPKKCRRARQLSPRQSSCNGPGRTCA